MRLDYEITKNDRASFARSIVHIRNRLGLNVATVLLLSLIILLAYHFSYGIHREQLPSILSHIPMSQISVIVHILIFTISAGLISYYIFHKVQKHYRRLMQHDDSKVSLQYDENGINYKTEQGQQCLDWNKLHAIVKLNSGIYLYCSAQRLPRPSQAPCIIIPRNAFHSDQAYRASVFYIQHKVEKIRQVA
ncbi:MAG: YcxB family protein [Coxiellaceae bacterium]|nr:YcxB family protein [Coxiellaceae bacterium]